MKIAIVLAAAVALSPALVSAEPKATPAPSESVDTGGNPAPAAKAPTRYCYDTEMTGSRLTRRVCQTREEWKRQGVEVPANL